MDISRYYPVFVDEATEHIQAMNSSLLELERNPGSQSAMGELFRSAHTLKGSSSTMGFRKIASLTHQMEDVLHAARASAGPLPDGMADLLLACTDAIESMLDSVIETSQEGDADYSALSDGLRRAAAACAGGVPAGLAGESEWAGESGESGEAGEAAGERGAGLDAERAESGGAGQPAAGAAAAGQPYSQHELAAICAALRQGLRAYEIRAALNEHCVMKAARAFVVFQALEKNADVIRTIPSVEDIEDENFELSFSATALSPLRADALAKALSNFSEVDAIDVAEITQQSIGLPDAGDGGGDQGGPGNSGPGGGAVSGGPGSGGASISGGTASSGEHASGNLGSGSGNPISGAGNSGPGGYSPGGGSSGAPALGNPAPGSPIPRSPDSKKNGLGAMAAFGADSGGAPGPHGIPKPPAAGWAAATPFSGAAAAKRLSVGKSIKVDISKLDKLMNLVSELILEKSRLRGVAASPSQHLSAGELDYLDQLASNLHEVVMKTRMISIENVFGRFPKMVRDISQSLGKDVELEMSGGDTELDRTVIDELGEPLLHILRNSIDHGIEDAETRGRLGKPAKGHVWMAASESCGHVVVEVGDDGAGIDVEKVRAKAAKAGLASMEQIAAMTDGEAARLIFEPSLSTKDQVSELSGRGVGMDIVKTKVESFGGSVGIETAKSEGTKISLRLPVSLVVAEALIVRVGQEKYAVGASAVAEVVRVGAGELGRTQNRLVMIMRDAMIPVVNLADVLGAPGRAAGQAEIAPGHPGGAPGAAFAAASQRNFADLGSPPDILTIVVMRIGEKYFG
ncbi:MAG: chemotaxis protein CheA, partial [Clostridiales bacterium]|nr:chemotaxis protein CheA [Clostridiales bacterium]